MATTDPIGEWPADKSVHSRSSAPQIHCPLEVQPSADNLILDAAPQGSAPSAVFPAGPMKLISATDFGN
jgi:hypothetical protein